MIKLRGQRIGPVLVLLLFCVFAASLLASLMLGAGIYKNIANISRDGYDERACLSYVWTKIKNGDAGGSVEIGNFHGLSALYLYEEIGGVSYQTIIYGLDGWMMELFCETGLNLLPEDGQPLLKTASIRFEQREDGLIEAQNDSGLLLITPRCPTAAR